MTQWRIVPEELLMQWQTGQKPGYKRKPAWEDPELVERIFMALIARYGRAERSFCIKLMRIGIEGREP